MWPVFMVTYNLPPDMCMKEAYIFMPLLISGPCSLGRNIDVSLRFSVKKLNVLWTGVLTWDANSQQSFLIRACLLWIISDFPTYEMLLGWSAHGQRACSYYMGDAYSFKLAAGKEACWWDCDKTFLPNRHLLCNDHKFKSKDKIDHRTQC